MRRRSRRCPRLCDTRPVSPRPPVAEAIPDTSPDGHETAFEAFGVRIGVGTNDSRVWSRLGELVPPHSRPCDPGDVQQHFSVATTHSGTTFTVRYDVRDGVAARPLDAVSYVATKVDLELALGLLDTHVQSCVGLNAPEHTFIEAGAVARNGRAILLAGKALSGKTTLVAALVSAGCTYYSDQYAVLDEQGRVVPYARPLSLPADARSETNHRGDVRAAIADAAPVPVGAVVATSYHPGAEWRPRRLSRGEGALALLSHAVAAQHRTEQAMRVINRALAHDPVMVASDRDEADAVAPSLLAGLDREAAAAP
jgi:hypothetical protein